MAEAVTFLEDEERIQQQIKDYQSDKDDKTEVVQRVQVIEDIMKTMPDAIVQVIDKRKEGKKNDWNSTGFLFLFLKVLTSLNTPKGDCRTGQLQKI